ncbi:hypothetical protein [Robertkochia sediminum]|uniref:hypothetical protein n=1 Tax=Robertkochia sediminum TaxID=2785326 RepID=UPI001931D2EF|nr:hypothetical protein [Robertkochia sediminum]MBL7473562.1 hypothetical protein [Robertkochia sediminum]
MPILPLDIENFNGKKLLFLLTLQEYNQSGYLTFYIDDQNELWYQDDSGMHLLQEIDAIPLIALYEELPDDIKSSNQYIHTPMVYVVEEYFRLVFGNHKIRAKE